MLADVRETSISCVCLFIMFCSETEHDEAIYRNDSFCINIFDLRTKYMLYSLYPTADKVWTPEGERSWYDGYCTRTFRFYFLGRRPYFHPASVEKLR